MSWQLDEAKRNFDELVRRAVEEGPQTITRHGEAVAVLLSAEAYRKLGGEGQDFKGFLSGPDLSARKLEQLRGLKDKVAVLSNDEVEAGELEQAYAEAAAGADFGWDEALADRLEADDEL